MVSKKPKPQIDADNARFSSVFICVDLRASAAQSSSAIFQLASLLLSTEPIATSQRLTKQTAPATRSSRRR
jgi:hypothetical protein